MFYTLSKALLFALQPMVWIFFALVLALLTKSRRKKRRLSWIAFGLFMVLGNSCLQTFVMDNWQWERTSFDDLTPSEYAVVLGGYGALSVDRPDIELNKAADRLTAGARLLEQGKVQQLVLSSGVQADRNHGITEAEASKTFLLALGLSDEQVICETKSWNTYQNAIYTARLLEESGHDGQPLVLVTSAFHMQRAKACFEKAGLDVTPFAVDYSWDRSTLHWSSAIIPNFKTVTAWQVLFKELVGTLVYRMRGYT